jgi:uncharacterized membrane protein
MTAATTAHAASVPRSTFVTVVAWIFIVLSGFAACISLLQNVILGLMPRDAFKSLQQDTMFAHTVPSGPRFMLAHVQLVVFVMLVVCLITLASSIGLLRRRNWARLLFIGLLGLGILYNVASVFMQDSMMSSFNTSFPTDSAFGQTRQQFTQMMQAFKAASLIFTVGLTALFAWIIAKLLSRSVRDEFVPVDRPAQRAL